MNKLKRFKYLDTIAFISIIGLFFGYLGTKMGISNMFNTIMETSHELLLYTVLKIMAIAVLAGAFGKLATEFGLVGLLNKIFSPLMRPLYNLPGSAFLGIITTYLSDNPAIISLANDNDFLKDFKRHEVPCLCNLGTAFGMGLIVTTTMMTLPIEGAFKGALIGNLAAIIGSAVSVRIMAIRTKKALGNEIVDLKIDDAKSQIAVAAEGEEKQSFSERFLSSILEGGKLGVDIGLGIIPGVLVICTIVIILTFGAANPELGFQGKAFEGVGLLPKLGEKLSFIIKPLFGFENPEFIAFPITALGAVGAALGLVDKFQGISANEIAVFTAMGMCWSGFISTHVAMMDSLKHRKLISKAITSHLIGGTVAGVSAHLIVSLLNL